MRKLARAPSSCERVREKGRRPKSVSFSVFLQGLFPEFSELELGQGEKFSN